MRKVDGEGHEGGRFVARKTEHHPLIARADGFHFRFGHFAGFGFEGFVYPHGDIAGLFGNRDLHAAGVAVESFFA